MSARSPYWHGLLCAETCDEVVQRMREVLDGQHFTLVTANSYDENSSRFLAVDVRTSQWLTRPLTAETKGGWTHIGWGTPAWSMGLDTRAKTQAEGHEGRPHKYVSLSFEPGRVKVDHYAPAGYRLLWEMVVERHDPEYGPSPAEVQG